MVRPKGLSAAAEPTAPRGSSGARGRARRAPDSRLRFIAPISDPPPGQEALLLHYRGEPRLRLAATLSPALIPTSHGQRFLAPLCCFPRACSASESLGLRPLATLLRFFLGCLAGSRHRAILQ